MQERGVRQLSVALLDPADYELHRVGDASPGTSIPKASVGRLSGRSHHSKGSRLTTMGSVTDRGTVRINGSRLAGVNCRRTVENPTDVQT